MIKSNAMFLASQIVPSLPVVAGCGLFLIAVFALVIYDPKPKNDKKKMAIDVYGGLLLEIGLCGNTIALSFIADKCDGFFCEFQDGEYTTDLYYDLLDEIDLRRNLLNAGKKYQMFS